MDNPKDNLCATTVLSSVGRENIGEEWRPISGTNGHYEVSNRGRVRSVPRWVEHDRGSLHGGIVTYYHKGRPITPHKLKTGYWAVTVSYERKERKRTLHQLLIEEFGPPRPFPKAVVRHLDDNKNNNALENLVWGTQADNAADMLRNGGMSHGSRHPGAKLDQEKVAYIRRSTASGTTYAALARELGVSQGAVYSAAKMLNWKHTQSVDQERMATAAIVRLQTRKR